MPRERATRISGFGPFVRQRPNSPDRPASIRLRPCGSFREARGSDDNPMDIPQHDWSGLRPDGQALPRDLKIAIDYIRENIGQQIRITDLLMATRAPERTLRKHFLRFFGLAPLTFFRRLRLAAARDALLAKSGDNVTDIASRFGFAHFGRFSSDYRRCFGELPSATRRRDVLLDQSAIRHERSRRHASRSPRQPWSSYRSERMGTGKATAWPTASENCLPQNLLVVARYPSGWRLPPLPWQRGGWGPAIA